MGKLTIIEHPLVQNKAAMLRNQNTGSKEFREVLEEIAMLIAYEATRDVALTDVEVETPLARAHVKMLDNVKFAIIPILRAGIGMGEGVLRLIPNASVGHIGLFRDPDTLLPVEYYCKLPGDIAEREVFLLDPMLATGGTSAAAVQFIKDRGAKNIKMLCVIVSEEGVKQVLKSHPDVDIYAVACDRELNSNGYIVPGLGDAGDRLYGTP